MEMISESMLSGPESGSAAGPVETDEVMAAGAVAIIGACWIAEGRGCSCWVGCILTVAFGSGGLAPSGGRVMRAVSFFGAALFCVTGSEGIAPPGAPGPGLSGTVGRAPIVGGFGGAAPSGFGAIG